jgi:hypothetical protein
MTGLQGARLGMVREWVSRALKRLPVLRRVSLTVTCPHELLPGVAKIGVDSELHPALIPKVV